MGPSCIPDGVSLPVQVDALIWRPFIINLKGRSSTARLCKGSSSKCSCQRIINKWPTEPHNELVKHKSCSSPLLITNVRTGNSSILHIIVKEKKWHSVEFGETNIPMHDLREAKLLDGRIELTMRDLTRFSSVHLSLSFVGTILLQANIWSFAMSLIEMKYFIHHRYPSNQWIIVNLLTV
jgi:hypothetical protein